MSSGIRRAAALLFVAGFCFAAAQTQDNGKEVAADSNGTLEVDWGILRGLDYMSGEMTPILKQLDGKVVKVPGFMVPLDDDSRAVTEFILVPYVGACIHTPPPPPNQMVMTTMREGRKAKVVWWDPIWVHGKLEITPSISPYGEVGYQITALKIEPYEYE